MNSTNPTADASRKNNMRLILPLLISALLATPVMAQSRYTTWSDPDSTKAAPASSSAEISELVRELNTLVDEATKARAASPLFLQDLKALAQKYSAPSLRRVLSDNFSDGNFTHAPRWTVSSGDYRVEKGWGLRSVATANTRQNSGQTSKGQDPAAALLGALLQGALTGKTQTGGQTATGVSGPSAASIYTSASINNAFDLTMEISSWKNTGEFSIGPWQGQPQRAGYHLTYRPGKTLSLLRINSRGRAIIDASARPVRLEDKQVHTLRWTRDTAGRMQVMLDKNTLIDVVDHSFRDPFGGLVIINQGSDVIVKSVAVDVSG